jgi:hypothetical protein
MNLYKSIGFVFIIMSGVVYTLERGFSILSTSIVKAGFFSGTMSGKIPKVEAVGFFENPFTPLFLFLGLILVGYGYKKKN